MKTYSDNNSTARLLVCSFLMTVAAISGFSLVQGQDDSSPLRPVDDSPATDPSGAEVVGAPIGLPGPTVSQPQVRYAYPLPRATDPAVIQLRSRYQELDTQINDLVNKYRATKDKREQSQIRSQIQELTNEQFDVRQAGRELEVERLKKRMTDVEASVEKRKSLKNRTVERRVEDVLNGPNELQWDNTSERWIPTYYQQQTTRGVNTPALPVGNPFKSKPGVSNVPSPLKPENAPLWAPGAPEGTTKRITRAVPRRVTENVVGPDGKTTLRTRVVYEFESVALPESQPLPGNDHVRWSNKSGPPPLAVGPSIDNQARTYANIASGTTVSETKARVRIVERKLRASRNLKPIERVELEGELEISKLQLEQAKRAYEATRKLVDLELRRAKVALEAAKTELDEANAVNKRIADSIPQGAIRLKETAVQRAKLAVETAETWVELHRQSQVKLDNQSIKDELEPASDLKQPPASPSY
ncbi:MAG: hypothetical protein CMJ64_25155 [Planctomycetaceae bacterium]|nr:hypothetical protein [Planctomycetaceae bacterium]